MGPRRFPGRICGNSQRRCGDLSARLWLRGPRASRSNHSANSFRCRFVAKQFTGLSVAMLVRQGGLSVDDDIRRYVSVVPDFGKAISIQNLLHHTSGLRDWPETLDLSGVDMEGPITLDMILEMVRRQRELDFAPGEEFQYSNTGYNLL